MRTVDLAAKAWKAMPHTLGVRLGFGSYEAPKHIELISWLLHLNAQGYVPRLGISMPPGSGKSEIVDFYDSIHLLEHNPRRRIILASYAGDLAEEQGKKVRNLIETHPDLLNVRIMQDSRAADKWRTNQYGGMWTVGIGGTITGRRASNLKIDDPHKNFAEAMNEKNQIDVWNWYTSVARTRMLPRSALAVIQTRWAEGDLIGRLKANDQNRGQWLFVALPAIAEQTETIDTVLGEWGERLRLQGLELPEWHREQGEALWPTLDGQPWFDEAEYASIEMDVGPVVWAGLYQQRPAPMEGSTFKRGDWVKLDGRMPRGKYLYVRRWDLAATPEGGDWTAGVLMALEVTTRRVYIVDVRRKRMLSHDVEDWVAETARDDRETYGNVLIRIEQEPGASGKAYGETFIRTVLEGFPVKFLPSSGKKEIRALALSGQVGAHNVHLCKTWDRKAEAWVVPEWWQPFIEEAAVFPHGAHDDMIDAASLAYIDLIDELPRRGKARAESAARRSLAVNALGL